MKNKDRIIISFETTEELKNMLQVEADNNEMSVSGLIRSILKKHFSNIN